MKPKIILWYDVEDYINPESNDALLGLIDMMDSMGIRGTFKVVGEKIRMLEKSGCQNIINKLKNHDIGFHTDLHSCHPTVSEYCNGLSFSEGAKKFEAREKKGYEDLKEILSRPVSTYGQAGAAWAPHVFPVLKKWEISSYIDAIDIINLNDKPFRYCRVLMMIHLSATLRMDLSESGLEKAKKEFDRMLACGEKYISIFYHPCEFIVKEFWDALNFGKGINAKSQSYRKSRLHSKEFMSHYIKQLGEFLNYLKSRSADFITAAEFAGADFVGDTKKIAKLSNDDIYVIACQWKNEISFGRHKGKWYCASEVFSLLKSSVLGQEPTPEFLYGPNSKTCTDNNNMEAKVSDFKNALRVDFPYVMGTGQLPDFFRVNGYKVCPEDMAATLAKIIREGLADEETIEVAKGNFTPPNYVRSDTYWGKSWMIFEESFDASNLVETTKLQTWTLKPA